MRGTHAFRSFQSVACQPKSPYKPVTLRGAAQSRTWPAHRWTEQPFGGAFGADSCSDWMEKAVMTSLDSFKCAKTLTVGTKTYVYYSLPEAEKHGLRGISRLPFSMKVLLENLLRHEDGRTGHQGRHPGASRNGSRPSRSERDIAFRPARVLMQDFTGVPAVVDLAAMRDAMKTLGGDPPKINPLVPVDLVIDHSVIVNFAGTPTAFKKNVDEEYAQNQERYTFLKWAQKAFDNFRVVPPGTGICHQVNLEYLSQTVWSAPARRR